VTADGATYCGFLLAIDRATGMARFSPVTSKSGAVVKLKHTEWIDSNTARIDCFWTFFLKGNQQTRIKTTEAQ
jgi:hypothetical protein